MVAVLLAAWGLAAAADAAPLAIPQVNWDLMMNSVGFGAAAPHTAYASDSPDAAKAAQLPAIGVVHKVLTTGDVDLHVRTDRESFAATRKVLSDLYQPLVPDAWHSEGAFFVGSKL